MLKIRHLHASIDGAPILQGLDLILPPGEVHAIMGPNGAGKSTIAKILSGHPAYEVTDGEIEYKGKNLLTLSIEERARLGLFMSFQHPVEIAGVSNALFLETALSAERKAKGLPLLSHEAFQELLEEKMLFMQMRSEFKDRAVNEGFSGGEKKRNEILQMALFEPDLAILDEIDSGLDIDALRIVADGINALRTPQRSMLLITHYPRLLDYVAPDRVHVLAHGKIVRSGGMDLARELEKKGYEWL